MLQLFAGMCPESQVVQMWLMNLLLEMKALQ